MTDAQRRAAFTHLLHSFRSSQDQAPAQRWLLLEASHVLGQQLLGLHWRSHCWMLRHALQLRDGREVAGQLLRLALVPWAICWTGCRAATPAAPRCRPPCPWTCHPPYRR